MAGPPYWVARIGMSCRNWVAWNCADRVLTVLLVGERAGSTGMAAVRAGDTCDEETESVRSCLTAASIGSSISSSGSSSSKQ